MAHSPGLGDGETFAVRREKFRKILGADFQRPVLIETNAHEGPVYVAPEHALYFTTVPEPGPKNVAIMRLQLAGDTFPFTTQGLETVRQPSNMANGMCLDRKGRLVICEQGTKDGADQPHGPQDPRAGDGGRSMAGLALQFAKRRGGEVGRDRVVHRSELRRDPRLQGRAGSRRFCLPPRFEDG